MTMIRLVVSDVDGTLVDANKKLTPATIDAIERLEQAGISFTIISARPRSGLMPIADTLGLDGVMAAFNGGIVFRRDGTIEAHHCIDEAVARGMFDLIGDAAVDRWVFADDKWYASSDRGVHVEHERIASNQEPIITDNFAAMLDRADKITFVSDDADLLSDLHERASARFGNDATVVQSQSYYLDVTALQANKGDGITELAAALDVPLAETAALGDQANDLPMLGLAGLSVAMGNATDGVKQAAGYVTRGNDDDGVAYAIDHIILPRIGGK